jgi:DNA-binding transcriptional LysR family regulator
MDRMAAMGTFVKVVEAGGFAAAGRKLKMSPSTVTEHIHALEAQLGARLLNRSTRKISVTEIGKAYYERCLQILADVEDADNVVQAAQAAPRGRLNLNASVAVPPLLAPVIAEFTALYPEVALSVTMSDRMLDMVEEGFDLAIRMLPLPQSSLIMRTIGTYRLLVCGSPEYFAARGVPQIPGDLVHHNCLNFSTSPWGSEWRFSGPDGLQTIAVSGNMDSNSANALRLAAVHGQGLTMLPGFLAAGEIASGRLVPVLTEFTRTEHPISAVYPHRLHLSTKVRSFLDLLVKHNRENPAWADPCRGRALPKIELPPNAVAASPAQPARTPIRWRNAAVG